MQIEKFLCSILRRTLYFTFLVLMGVTNCGAVCGCDFFYPESHVPAIVRSHLPIGLSLENVRVFNYDLEVKKDARFELFWRQNVHHNLGDGVSWNFSLLRFVRSNSVWQKERDNFFVWCRRFEGVRKPGFYIPLLDRSIRSARATEGKPNHIVFPVRIVFASDNRVRNVQISIVKIKPTSLLAHDEAQIFLSDFRVVSGSTSSLCSSGSLFFDDTQRSERSPNTGNTDQHQRPVGDEGAAHPLIEAFVLLVIGSVLFLSGAWVVYRKRGWWWQLGGICMLVVGLVFTLAGSALYGASQEPENRQREDRTQAHFSAVSRECVSPWRCVNNSNHAAFDQNTGSIPSSSIS